MRVLEGLEPESVFYYFEEITRIPHGSGNVKRISDYLKQFAQDHGLECIQDELYNIIMIKEATAGYGQTEPYILQGHMDMVAVSRPDCDIDMTKEPLRLRMENGRIYAEGTSLGGDDGIAVAYVLALLAADDISHPRLEVILTADEETGMEGARKIDLSMLRGKRLINLDQEQEGVIITSCAGGARVDVDIPLRREKRPVDGQRFLQIKVKGLLGGHSGIEINKGRGNANYLSGRILRELSGQFRVRLSSMEGGLADNAIPREAKMTISVDVSQTDAATACVRECGDRIRRELGENDPGFMVECTAAGWQEECFDADSTAWAAACLCSLPNGVTAMSKELEGLVQTSLNLGVAALEGDELRLSYAVRSSVDAEKEQLCRQMKEIAAKAGASVKVRNSYPGWAYRTDSPLRDIVTDIYEKMYGKKPVLEAIHAGVECGILTAKIDGLDCVSIGPDMSDVHTAEESLDIASVQRVWKYLLEVLAYQ